VALPENVFRILKPSGKVYYYHQRHRKKPKGERGALTRIDHAPHEPEFWLKAAELNGGAPDRAVPVDIAKPLTGSFRWLIALYKDSPKWRGHADGTQRTYAIYLQVIEDAWGNDLASDLDVDGIIALRDEMAKTAPSAANMLVTVLRALMKWGINNGKCKTNPARDIEEVETEVEHAFPWPLEIWRRAVDKAPADVSRLAFLGRATGQRISDLIRLRPTDLKGDLFHIKVKKLRQQVHLLPISAADRAVIESWDVADLVPFIVRPNGKRHSEESLRDALAAWIKNAKVEEKPGEEIRPHGLRAMACCDARLNGLDHDDIAALYRMSPRMVRTYTFHIDKEAEARNALAKMGAVQTIGRVGANSAAK
jgi:integrase